MQESNVDIDIEVEDARDRIFTQLSFFEVPQNPLVSIIIPTYNRPDLLFNAIESVINQLYTNIEIIVVNDAGEDVSHIIDAFADTRVRYFTHEENQKISAARNTGLMHAKGKYIAYLDDDDIYYPNHIGTLVRFLESNDVDIAYTDAYEKSVGTNGLIPLSSSLGASAPNPDIPLYKRGGCEADGVCRKGALLAMPSEGVREGDGSDATSENHTEKPYDLLFVGNNNKHTQKTTRKIIKTLLDIGKDYNLKVVGQFWKDYLDPKYILANYIDPQHLPDLYSKAKIILNDHQEAMQDLGFINNRTYDLAALQQFQISDYVVGIEDLGIVTYTSQDDLAGKIDYYLQNDSERERIAKINRALVQNYSFAAIANELITTVYARFIPNIHHRPPDTDLSPTTKRLQAYPLEKLFPQLPWQNHNLGLRLSYLEIARSYAIEQDQQNALDFYSKAFGLYGVPRSEVTLPFVAENLKNLLNEEQTRLHLDTLAKHLHFASAIPLVSVIVTTHNHPDQLQNAIQSVKNQDYKNLEIINVGLNGIPIPENSNPATARNTGIQNANGNYIAYLEDNAIFYPNHISTLVDYLEKNNAHIAYSNFVGDVPVRPASPAAIPIFTLIHKKECLLKTGLFNEDLPEGEVQDLLTRLSAHYKLHHLDTVTTELKQVTTAPAKLKTSKKKAEPAPSIQTLTQNPFITICIPTYNRADLISESIMSAFDQTYQNYEILIMDDGSTDNTEEVIHGLEEGVSAAVARKTGVPDEAVHKNYITEKLRYIKKEHSNIPDTRNHCIKYAKGDFILWLDSDDILMSDILSVYISFANQYPDVDVFYGNIKLIGDYYTYGKNEIIYQDNYKINGDLLARFVTQNRLPNGAFIKKSVYDKYGGYNTECRKASDYEFWSRIIDKVLFKHITTYSYYWRWHSDNISTFHAENDFSTEAKVLTSLIEKFSLRELFPYLDWENDKTTPIFANLEIAKTYAKWEERNLSLKYYQIAFNEAGITVDNLNFLIVINTLKSLLNSDNLIKEHTDVLAKFFLDTDIIKVEEIFNHRQYLQYMLKDIKNHKEKKKILFVLHDFPPYKVAGIQNYALSLAKRLNTFPDVHVDIFYPVFRDGPGDYSIQKTSFDGLEVYQLYKLVDDLFSMDKVYNFKVGIAFARFLKEHKYDLIHFHSFGQLSIIVADIAQELGIKTFFTLHDNWISCYHWHRITPHAEVCNQIPSPEICTKCLIKNLNQPPSEYERIKMMLEYRESQFRKTLSRFDQVIAVSEFIKRNTLQFATRNIIVNHIGFPESSDGSPNSPLIRGVDAEGGRGVLVFGYMGQIAPHKGLHILIEAFTKLQGEQLELRIYGKSKNAQYLDYIQKMAQNDKRITFYGEYKPTDLKDIIPNFSVIVLPSLMECFPLVAMEAFQYKTPVIASNVGGIPELVTDGVNGLLFENNNPDDLYEKLKYLTEHPETLSQFASNCKIEHKIEDDVLWTYRLATGSTPQPTTQPSVSTPQNSTFSPKKRIMIYYFKNVHIPILAPITNALIQRDDIELAIGYMPFAPQIRAGFTPAELQLIKSYNLPMYVTPQDFNPDVTVIADSVYPWVQGCGKLVHIGHGVLAKGQYYTDTDTARREEQADLVCVPGIYHQKIMQHMVTKPIHATGMPKLDKLFSGQITRATELQRLQLPKNTFYVLFAPTFNEELSAIPFVEDKIHEVLPTPESILLIKLHPSTDIKYKEMYKNLQRTETRVIYIEELDIAPYLAIADVVISDVSSAMMEAAALGKPIVLFNNPNQKNYANYNPADLEYAHRDIGYQVNNLQDMKLAVLKVQRGKDICQRQRQSISDMLFANKYDGKATERIVELVLECSN